MSEYPYQPEEPIEVVARRLDELVRGFETHPDMQVRRDVFTLLERVDALHRTALTRLIIALRAAGAGAALARAMDDPAVRLLLELYGLLPGDDPAPVELALDQVRPYLATHGGGVRLVGVMDGVVRLRLSGPPHHQGEAHTSPRAAVEAVLREHFPALQRIEVEETAPTVPANFIPLTAIGVPAPPPARAWRPAAALTDVPAGAMRRVVVAGHWLALCNVAGELHALRDACPGSLLPLTPGELDGAELRCPWHGCHFDVRTGRRTRGDGADLETFPVQVVDGQVQVGLPADRALPAGGKR